MAINLIAIDIDGTLLDDNHQLPLKNEIAIRSALENGVQVILATGRMRVSCEWVIERLGLQAPGIYVQGMYIADAEGNRIHGEWLDANTLMHFLPFAQKHQLSFVAFADEKTVTLKRDKYTDIILNYDEPEPMEVADVTAVPIHKVIIFSEPERIRRTKPLLVEHMNGQADILITQPEMLEIIPAGISKGTGLAWLSQNMGIPLSHTMAIGNAENDIAMLQRVGLSIAVGNAMESVKEVCTYQVATNNEAGVAEAIERFVL